MVLDWYCPKCGLQAVAVALKRGEELHRVKVSHHYHSADARWQGKHRDICKGEAIQYAERQPNMVTR
jgi:hypothetical protein